MNTQKTRHKKYAKKGGTKNMHTLAPTNLQFRVGGWQEKILMRQRKLIFMWFLGNEIATESTTRNSFSILIKKESRIAINAD